jgi:hypothetical protein
VVALDIQ